MSGNISGIRTLTMYNNDIPLSEPTAMESIGESTAMGGVLVGGIKGAGYVWKGAKWMMHPVRNTRTGWQMWQQNNAVRSSIMKNNPVGLARHREYSAYQEMKQMSKTMPKNPVSAEGRTAKLVTEQVAKGKGLLRFSIFRQKKNWQLIVKKLQLSVQKVL